MKIKLLSLLILSTFFLSFTSPRKEKRTILKKVDQYIEQTISDTTYTVDKAQMLVLLDYYFLSNGYVCTGLSPSNVRYSKPIQYTRWSETTETTKRRVEWTIETNNEGVEQTKWVIVYDTTPKEKRTIYHEQVSVVIELFELGESYRILTNKIRSNNVHNPFNEPKLRRFLYSQCFGNNLSLPRALSEAIEAYNNTQTKERKKIVFD